MAGFVQKYEVQKGRTVTCRMGIAHEGAILELKNFSGDDEKVKQSMIDTLVSIGALKPAPLTDSEKQALAELEEAEKEKENAKSEKEAAILSADFDEMNKQPMLDFAEQWGIELKETRADDIRAELNLLKESLKSL